MLCYNAPVKHSIPSGRICRTYILEPSLLEICAELAHFLVFQLYLSFCQKFFRLGWNRIKMQKRQQYHFCIPSLSRSLIPNIPKHSFALSESICSILLYEMIPTADQWTIYNRLQRFFQHDIANHIGTAQNYYIFINIIEDMFICCLCTCRCQNKADRKNLRKMLLVCFSLEQKN